MGSFYNECSSCRSPMPPGAVKCAHCGEWRQDVKREKSLYYFWSLLALVPLVLFFIGYTSKWWPTTKTNASAVFNSWMSKTDFSWDTFLSSPSGLLITVAFIVSGVISTIYYVSVSKKIGKWFWL